MFMMDYTRKNENNFISPHTPADCFPIVGSVRFFSKKFPANEYKSLLTVCEGCASGTKCFIARAVSFLFLPCIPLVSNALDFLFSRVFCLAAAPVEPNVESHPTKGMNVWMPLSEGEGAEREISPWSLRLGLLILAEPIRKKNFQIPNQTRRRPAKSQTSNTKKSF